MSETPDRSFDSLRLMLRSVAEEVGQSVVGQSEIVRQLLLCLAAGGHALLEGPPGVGKSLLAHSIAAACGLVFAQLPMTTDVTPADVLEGLGAASGVPGATQSAPGRLFANLVLAGEIDQSSPRAQTSLLQAMQERAITVGGQTWPMPSPFAVVATQSPAPLRGPHPLSERQLDSFLMKLVVEFPSADDLTRIIGRTTGPGTSLPRRVADPPALYRLVQLVRQVPIARHVTDYAVRLVLASHPAHVSAPPLVRQHVASGASPRGAQTLVIGAKAAALADGRFNVSFGDLRLVALPALRHRLILTGAAREAGVDVDGIISQLLSSVEEEP